MFVCRQGYCELLEYSKRGYELFTTRFEHIRLEYRGKLASLFV